MQTDLVYKFQNVPENFNDAKLAKQMLSELDKINFEEIKVSLKFFDE